jgi:hypothetical protein
MKTAFWLSLFSFLMASTLSYLTTAHADTAATPRSSIIAS